MDSFVPREKMGKKARRELDTRRRRTWGFSPAVRKVESRKAYNRHRKDRGPFSADDIAPESKTPYNIRYR